MCDTELAALIERAMGPFPRGLGGEEIEGVDLVLLDEVIMGVASHYKNNSRVLSDEHRDMLIESLHCLDRIDDALATDEARDYFARARAVGRYILEERAARA